MEMWIGDLLADASPPEKPRFKAPLLLVHGLWTGSWCWQAWATHFSNLGWECWAVNLRGRFEKEWQPVLKRLHFQRCVEDVRKVVRGAPYPPVVMGHSLGGLIAQRVAEQEEVSALVLLSSLPPPRAGKAAPRPLRLLRLKYSLLMALRRPFCLEQKDFRSIWLASVPESEQPDILRRMVPESIYLIREFFFRRAEIDPERIRCPVLVVGGSEDRVVPAVSLREVAQSLRADLKQYPDHGHWVMGEAGGDVVVRDIHRWIVQKLGEGILLAEFSEQH